MVLNPASGKVESAIVFDTYKGSEAFDSFIAQDMTAENKIIVAACKDECVTQLSDRAKQWFADMGSSEIWNLGYREGFSFIGITGKESTVEQRAHTKYNKAQVSRVFKFNITVPLVFQTLHDIDSLKMANETKRRTLLAASSVADFILNDIVLWIYKAFRTVYHELKKIFNSEKAKELIEIAQEFAEDALEEIEDLAEDAMEYAKDGIVELKKHAGDVQEFAEDAYDDAKDLVEDAKDFAKDAHETGKKVLKDAEKVAKDVHQVAKDVHGYAKDGIVIVNNTYNDAE